MRPAGTRIVRLVPIVVIAALVVGCRPLFVPGVPERLPPFAEELRIAEARIVTLGEHLDVVFVPERVPRAGWLAVQWFPPAGAEAASASTWLSPQRVGRTVRIRLPDDVAREPAGRWRAVLSFEGRIVRQLEWSEPAGP